MSGIQVCVGFIMKRLAAISSDLCTAAKQAEENVRRGDVRFFKPYRDEVTAAALPEDRPALKAVLDEFERRYERNEFDGYDRIKASEEQLFDRLRFGRARQGELMSEIKKLDPGRKFFAAFNDAQYPGWSQVVQRNVNFTTLLNKVEKTGQFKDLSEFVAEVNIMWDNIRAYFKDRNSEVRREADILEDRCKKLFSRFEEKLKFTPENVARQLKLEHPVHLAAGLLITAGRK
jgi:hypothetical protein